MYHKPIYVRAQEYNKSRPCSSIGFITEQMPASILILKTGSAGWATVPGVSR